MYLLFKGGCFSKYDENYLIFGVTTLLYVT